MFVHITVDIMICVYSAYVNGNIHRENSNPKNIKSEIIKNILGQIEVIFPISNYIYCIQSANTFFSNAPSLFVCMVII